MDSLLRERHKEIFQAGYSPIKLAETDIVGYIGLMEW